MGADDATSSIGLVVTLSERFLLGCVWFSDQHLPPGFMASISTGSPLVLVCSPGWTPSSGAGNRVCLCRTATFAADNMVLL